MKSKEFENKQPSHIFSGNMYWYIRFSFYFELVGSNMNKNVRTGEIIITFPSV